MRWGICLAILLGMAAHGHADDVFPPVGGETLRRTVRQAMAFEVRRIDAMTAEGEARLIAIVKDEGQPEEVRRAAIDNLAFWSIPSERTRQVLLHLVSPATEEFTCRHAAQTLQGAGVPASEAIPALLRVVGDTRDCSYGGKCGSNTVSRGAIEAIAAYGDEASGAIDRLEAIAAGEARGDGEAARQVLGDMAPWSYPLYAAAEIAALPLAAQLSSSDPDKARPAALRLLKLHKFALPAVPALERALGSGDDQVRLTSAAALMAISPYHYEAQQVFADLAAISGGFERKRIPNWVKEYDLPYDDTPLLRAMLDDPIPSYSVEAARRLARRKQHEDQALATLVELYNTGDSSSQQRVVLAMGSFRPELLAPHRELIEQAVASRLYQADRLLKTIPLDESDPSASSIDSDKTAAANP